MGGNCHIHISHLQIVSLLLPVPFLKLLISRCADWLVLAVETGNCNWIMFPKERIFEPTMRGVGNPVLIRCLNFFIEISDLFKSEAITTVVTKMRRHEISCTACSLSSEFAHTRRKCLRSKHELLGDLSPLGSHPSLEYLPLQHSSAPLTGNKPYGGIDIVS